MKIKSGVWAWLSAVSLLGGMMTAMWLGGKLIWLAEAGITLALMAFGGFGYGSAATRAPLILWAVLCTLAGVGLYAWNCRQENRRYEAAARRQQADEAAAKTMDKRSRRRKAG